MHRNSAAGSTAANLDSFPLCPNPVRWLGGEPVGKQDLKAPLVLHSDDIIARPVSARVDSVKNIHLPLIGPIAVYSGAAPPGIAFDGRQ
jgi:hypothetical protein